MIPATGTSAFRLGRVWATLAIAGLAVLARVFPTWAGPLIYDRSLLLEGQVWRAWTGHLVHFGWSHLLWDLAVLLPSGCWLERVWPRQARWLYVVCPPVISLVLLMFDPKLLLYAGLSGLAAGVLVLLAGRQLRSGNGGPAWFWVGVLVLVGAKIAYELISGGPMVVSDLGGDVRNVPLAHVGGAACGAIFWLTFPNSDRDVRSENRLKVG